MPGRHEIRVAIAIYIAHRSERFFLVALHSAWDADALAERKKVGVGEQRTRWPQPHTEIPRRQFSLRQLFGSCELDPVYF